MHGSPICSCNQKKPPCVRSFQHLSYLHLRRVSRDQVQALGNTLAGIPLVPEAATMLAPGLAEVTADTVPGPGSPLSVPFAQVHEPEFGL